MSKIRAILASLGIYLRAAAGRRPNKMLMFFEITWWAWVGWLVIGDSVANFAFGEQYSLTHFLSTRIATSLRVPIIAWVAYHFLVAHRNS